MKDSFEREYKDRLGALVERDRAIEQLRVADELAELLGSYVNHEHVYWSSPTDLARCKGINSIDECNFTMNLRRQFKNALAAYSKARGAK